jgi:hypothetical protein
MENEIKRIDIKEFREKGYLQELNRQFLHPLGLALEIVQNSDGTETLGGVWDYRDDKEGIQYDYLNSNDERIKLAKEREELVKNALHSRIFDRFKGLGFIIEPIINKK